LAGGNTPLGHSDKEDDMLGAIIGDIAGSVYEFQGHKWKDFEPFLRGDAFFTDDSVLTVAVADALIDERPPVEAFKDWGRRYPDSGWGGRFSRWLFSQETAPYGSYGNGAAMRVSPAGLLGRTPEEALAFARRVTEVTHDHPEGLKGAAATTLAIFLALRGETVSAIRRAVGKAYGYDLDRTVDGIRPGYRFDETCQGTVPEALICALEAVDYEDAIRNAISLGGDSDTLGAIAGGIAEARFGIPDDIAAEGWRRLPVDMREMMAALYRRAGRALPGGRGAGGTPSG
jgi:ADP-ribosyl-[dinitrogen reductase] hydrolase